MYKYIWKESQSLSISENNELFNISESPYFHSKIYMYINRYIIGDNESVRIGVLHINQAFKTNSIQ